MAKTRPRKPKTNRSRPDALEATLAEQRKALRWVEKLETRLKTLRDKTGRPLWAEGMSVGDDYYELLNPSERVSVRLQETHEYVTKIRGEIEKQMVDLSTVMSPTGPVKAHKARKARKAA